MLANTFDKISFWSLFAVVVLLPIFFFPQIPIETSKGIILVIGVALSAIFWMAARFSDGKVILPRSYVLLSAFLVLFVTFISALFSQNASVSLFGTMLDTGSFYFLLSAFVLMLLSSIILSDISKVKTVLWGVMISSTILFLLQILRGFIPEISLGVLFQKTENVFGSWNALGIFAGFSVFVSLFISEFFSISKVMKWLMGIFTVLSLLILAFVNYPLAWGLVGVFSLLVCVYKINSSFSEKEKEKIAFPVFPFVVVMISLFFFILGGNFGTYLPEKLGLANVEVMPSLSATIDVASDSLKEDPILGIGPNKFAQVWSMYKPEVINMTDFWNSVFAFGSGLLPTLFLTTGALGIISWIVFFVLLVTTGVKNLLSSIKKKSGNEPVFFFLASLFLFLSSFFYSVGAVIYLLAFVFAGIFIGFSLQRKNAISFSFLDDPRRSFISILGLVVFIVLFAGLGFKYIERVISVPHFTEALSAKDASASEAHIRKALSLYNNDLYLRSYAQIQFAKVNSLISKAGELSEDEKASLQSSFREAQDGALLAIKYDDGNYQNYILLGNIYSTAGMLGEKDAYSKAIELYTKALSLNPLNPGIHLAVAKLYSSDGKIEESRKHFKEALALKPNFLEALIFASQFEKANGNISLATSYAEEALTLSPKNKSLLQYVESLKKIDTKTKKR